jgi:hypothetical protein
MTSKKLKNRLEAIRRRIRDGFYADPLVVEVIATRIMKEIDTRRLR